MPTGTPRTYCKPGDEGIVGRDPAPTAAAFSLDLATVTGTGPPGAGVAARGNEGRPPGTWLPFALGPAE